jgi:hypothetical protein
MADTAVFKYSASAKVTGQDPPMADPLGPEPSASAIRLLWETRRRLAFHMRVIDLKHNHI